MKKALSKSKTRKQQSQSARSVVSSSGDGPIRVGVVGCGNVMDTAYMPVLDKLRHQGFVQVTGASHTSRDRCQSVLERWSIPKYFPSHEPLCNSPDVDLVLVLTSMAQHGDIALAALRAGKHVFVEKPMAVSLDSAKRLVAESQTSAGYLVCAPFVILSPTYQIIRDRIHSGDIGKVCLARGRYGWAGPDWSDWFYKAGGGPIFDLAVYNITSLTGIFGPAKRVMAMTGKAQPKRVVNGKEISIEVEDNAQIMLDFGDAVFATITSGFTMQKYRSPGLELYGTEGTIQMLGDDWGPEGYELWQNRVGAWQTYYETDPQWRWTAGLPHLIDCVRKKQRPLVTPEHAYHVLEIMLAARASGRDGRALDIKSTFSVEKQSDSHRASGAAHRVHDYKRE